MNSNNKQAEEHLAAAGWLSCANLTHFCLWLHCALKGGIIALTVVGADQSGEHSC